MARSLEAFPTLYGDQITTASAEARWQPGQYAIHKGDSGNTAMLKYVQLDNNGCSIGQALVTNFATIAGYSVKCSAATDSQDAEPFKFQGIAAATIASQYFGWMIVGGWCEYAELSLTAASGDYLGLGASTAGGLSKLCGRRPVAISRTAIATGTGSVTVLGMWA